MSRRIACDCSIVGIKEDESALPGMAHHHDVNAWIEREFFEANIEDETCTAKWHEGERMD